MTDRRHKAEELARAVFGSRKNALTWLKTPCFALGNSIPGELLKTDEGAKLVMDTLHRIQYGVYN